MPHISRLNDPLMNPRIKVGAFHVPMTITNLATGAAATVEALVDTGATLSVDTASLLARLGVQPTSERAFELADGRFVTLPLGRVLISVEGEEVPTLCIFGSEDVSATLGVVVLEMAGLTIDPAARRLVPTPGLLL